MDNCIHKATEHLVSHTRGGVGQSVRLIDLQENISIVKN